MKPDLTGCEQMYDAEGVTLESAKPFEFVCCDCGLTHDCVIASEDGKPVGFAVRRNDAATKKRRGTAPSACTAPLADEQWFGDVMILQVLADSDQVNEQEREVLQRWIAASQPPSREMALAQRTSDLHHKAGMPLEQAKELARSEMIEDTSACTAPAKECATGCVRAAGVKEDQRG